MRVHGELQPEADLFSPSPLLRAASSVWLLHQGPARARTCSRESYRIAFIEQRGMHDIVFYLWCPGDDRAQGREGNDG